MRSLRLLIRLELESLSLVAELDRCIPIDDDDCGVFVPLIRPVMPLEGCLLLLLIIIEVVGGGLGIDPLPLHIADAVIEFPLDIIQRSIQIQILDHRALLVLYCTVLYVIYNGFVYFVRTVQVYR